MFIKGLLGLRIRVLPEDQETIDVHYQVFNIHLTDTARKEHSHIFQSHRAALDASLTQTEFRWLGSLLACLALGKSPEEHPHNQRDDQCPHQQGCRVESSIVIAIRLRHFDKRGHQDH